MKLALTIDRRKFMHLSVVSALMLLLLVQPANAEQTCEVLGPVYSWSVQALMNGNSEESVRSELKKACVGWSPTEVQTVFNDAKTFVINFRKTSGGDTFDTFKNVVGTLGRSYSRDCSLQRKKLQDDAVARMQQQHEYYRQLEYQRQLRETAERELAEDMKRQEESRRHRESLCKAFEMSYDTCLQTYGWRAAYRCSIKSVLEYCSPN